MVTYCIIVRKKWKRPKCPFTNCAARACWDPCSYREAVGRLAWCGKATETHYQMGDRQGADSVYNVLAPYAC